MKIPARAAEGHVHCPICTHTVPANIEYAGKQVRVVPGQKCGRCGSSLAAAALLYVRQAA